MNKQFIKKFERALKKIPYKEIEKAIKLLLQIKGNIYIFGNGGSWALAQHAVADFNHVGLQCVCIPSSISELTAWSNDAGYEMSFAGPLINVLEKKDIVIAISSSGNSPNIIKAVEFARIRKVPVIGFSGFDKNNKLNMLVDIKIHIPTERGEYGIVETMHDLIIHFIKERLA